MARATLTLLLLVGCGGPPAWSPSAPTLRDGWTVTALDSEIDALACAPSTCGDLCIVTTEVVEPSGARRSIEHRIGVSGRAVVRV